MPGTNELIIAAILYLVAERGKPIPRRVFAEMFFQNADPDVVAHSGRNLIYRLRKIGIGLTGDAASITLPHPEAQWDLELLTARGRATESELRDLLGGYLSNFSGHQSGNFVLWLDEHRDSAKAELRALLVRQVQAARERREFGSLGPIARACLVLDPLNEEATLAAAEALVTSGAKTDALQLLEQYLEEVGSRSHELRVAPKMLRERISSYVNEPEREQIALVGRSDELATLMSRIEDSAARSSQVCFVWGPGGIGKTRLIDEACAIAALSGHAVANIRLSRHDIERPFAVLRDLGPTLLELPGAIGAAPEALAAVRGLCGRGPSQYLRRPTNAYDTRAVAADIQRKVIDLVDAVTEEQPLIIRVEDADRLDEASLELIELLLDSGRRISVLIASRARIAFLDRFAASAAATQIPLTALGREDSMFVLQHLFRQSSRPVDSTFVENAVRISAGVPLFLHALFRNFLATEDPRALPSTLADSLRARLDQLQEPAKSVFDAVVALSTLSTVDRIEEITELPRYSLMQALRLLEEQGFLRFGEGAVLPSHDLLADASRSRLPPTLKGLLHRAIAESLENQNVGQIDPLAIAFHWEACGENERALRVLVTSARSSTALGQPRQAIALLQRANGLASRAADMSTIDATLLEACYAAGEDNLGLTAAERLGALSGQGSLECQLMGIEICAKAGKDLLPFQVYLQPVVSDRSLHSSIRARAARLLIMVAEDLGDAALGSSTLASLSDIIEISIELLVPRLIFETVFGESAKAVDLASELCQAINTTESVGTRLQGMWTAAVALYRCGETARAREIASKAHELATANGVWSACTAFAAMMGEVAWHEGNVVLAQDWFDRTSQVLSRPGGTDRAQQYFGLGISLALGRNDPQEAVALFRRAEKLFPDMRQQRLSLAFLATRVLIELQLGASPSDQDLDELRRGHTERQSLGNHDFIADVLIAALRRGGHFEEARSIRDDYIARHRKERIPIAPVYRSLST